MVKAKPKIPTREARKRKRLGQSLTPNLLLNYKPTPVSPSSNHLHLLHPTTFKPQESDQITRTPPPSKKKRTYSLSSSSTSPSYSSSTYATCSSSSSPPLSPSSPSFLHPNYNSHSSPATERTHQPQLLRRTVSDPPVFTSDSSSNSKKMRRVYNDLRASPSLSPPVLSHHCQLLPPPLPPLPSPKLLRRTVSDPVPLLSSPAAVKSTTTAEEAVKVEKLSQQLVWIKFKCGCGSDCQFLLSNTDNKCYKLVV